MEIVNLPTYYSQDTEQEAYIDRDAFSLTSTSEQQRPGLYCSLSRVQSLPTSLAAVRNAQYMKYTRVNKKERSGETCQLFSDKLTPNGMFQ